MCGICGVVGAPTPDAERGVGAMTAQLCHRGPDAAATCTVPGGHGATVLGHRRLRIRDLSAAAAQPMRSASGVWITYNGELYNDAALRTELTRRGHRFTSTGDTEVVLRAFDEWGAQAVTRLDGMFAVAAWDERTGRLLLARDPVGKKPLFFCHRGGRVTFGSEVKALRAAPWLEVAPALEHIAEYLALGYVGWPRSWYRDVEQVPPGGLVEYDSRTDTVERRAWWSPLGHGGPEPTPGEIRYAIESAVRRRMVADVPLGAFLSGGIDSSVVCALMQRASPEPVLTFSAGYADEPSYDEREWAAQVARHLGTRHTEFVVKADAIRLLDDLVRLHDGPFGDSSAIPTYLVSQAAREHVTVALTGDGGDEVFAGYERFAAARIASLVPRQLNAVLRRTARALPNDTTSYSSLRRRLERFADPTADGVLDRYVGWVSVFDRRMVAALTGSPERPVPAPYADAFSEAAGLPDLDRILHANLRTYLTDDLCVKVDRCSMGNSLELRSPLLDRRLIELVGRVRARRRIGLRQVKPLLRATCEDLVPAAVWNRPKHGFGVPVDRWFREDLGAVFDDTVLALDSRVGDVVDLAGVRRLRTEHVDGRGRHGARLWSLLTLEHWLRDVGTRPQPGTPSSAVTDVFTRAV